MNVLLKDLVNPYSRLINMKEYKSLLSNPQERFCRWCGNPSNPPKLFWCSEECSRKGQITTSNMYAKKAVLKRDRGICASCKLDTYAFRKKLLEKIPISGHDAVRRYAQRLGFDINYTHWWHNDHIIPVASGGGCCDIDNYQTLCVPCHMKKIKSEKGRGEIPVLEDYQI